MAAVEKKRQSLTGIVIGNKMEKTVKVLVKNKQRHPVYGKYINVSREFLAHVEDASVVPEGRKVVIVSCSPVSKNKSWKVVEVIAD